MIGKKKRKEGAGYSYITRNFTQKKIRMGRNHNAHYFSCVSTEL